MLVLDLARMKITDEMGKYLLSYLKRNTTLRSLYLEGNLLGSKSAMELGAALKVNKTLKTIDLESNQLVGGDSNDTVGMYEFIDFLTYNKTLLSLNIANNQLDEKIGEMFKEKLLTNDTLICLDFSRNDFTMLHSQEMQDHMKKNKAAYDAERMAEWKERCNMKGEDSHMRRLKLSENAVWTRDNMESDARAMREADLNAKWDKKMVEQAIEKQQLID